MTTSALTVPGKGLFTQSAFVLLSRVPAREERIQALLLATDHEVRESAGGRIWYEGGPLTVIPFAPERNGYVLLDVLDRRWPDDLDGGRADTPDAAAEMAAAWKIGHFGPGTWPGCLSRAAQHSWAWKAGANSAIRHQALLRLRLTYLLGVPGAVHRPYLASDPVTELLYLTQLIGALLTLRGALGCFLPAGESLRGAAFLEERLQLHRHGGPPPLDVWTNVRYQPVDETGWVLMDTIGMSQLDLPDIEAAFPAAKEERYPPPEVAAFLRNTALRMLRERNGDSLPEWSELPGPGGIPWRVQRRTEGFAAPPRPTLRFVPRALPRPPAALR